MTTQLVRTQAKEIAGQFYEQEQRSLRFRAQWPDARAYVAANWVHFVDLARGSLAALLARPDYPEHLKEAITRDLLEEHERQQSPHARTVMQATLDPVEKEERRFIDESHNLPSVSG